MKAIEKYTQYLRFERNFSQHTEISYLSDLSQFEQFLIQTYGEDFSLEQATERAIRSWISSLSNQKRSARSIARKLSTLKSFFSFLHERNLIDQNPTKSISTPKISKPLPAFVSHSQLKNLIQEGWTLAKESNQHDDIRDMLLVELMYLTGMRRSEVIALKDTDVDFSRQQILVSGKAKSNASSQSALIWQKR